MPVPLFPNRALSISKDKTVPCVHVMTVNKQVLYCLVANFKEAQEFLQKFPSSTSLKDKANMETLAQSKPSNFRNFRQVK